MAEVLVQIDSPIREKSGQGYVALVCGREGDGGHWEGWIEFDPGDGGAVLRTPRETTQPNREALEYWAGGLTTAYFEGALTRALGPDLPDLRPRTVAARATYDGPASRADSNSASVSGGHGTPIIDPFAVYAQGEDLLRSELGAFDEGHLRNIVRGYNLADEKDLDLQSMHRVSLVELIVAAVRKRVP